MNELYIFSISLKNAEIKMEKSSKLKYLHARFFFWLFRLWVLWGLFGDKGVQNLSLNFWTQLLWINFCSRICERTQKMSDCRVGLFIATTMCLHSGGMTIGVEKIVIQKPYCWMCFYIWAISIKIALRNVFFSKGWNSFGGGA